MNVALRTVHAGAFAVLGVVLLPLAALALHARPDRGRVDARAIMAGASSSNSWTSVDTSTANEVFPGIRIEHRDQRVLLRATPELREPDVLVYADSQASAGPRLRTSARLLGSVVPGRDLEVARPSAASGETELILYSLGHQKILASIPLASDAPGVSSR